MITIHDLLEDSTYKEFFCRPPKGVPLLHPDQKPWRLYIQMNGSLKWAYKDCATYSEAFKRFRKALKAGEVHDAAISSRRHAWRPPNRIARIKGKYVIGSDGVRRQATKPVPWRPKLNGEDIVDPVDWCPYCRRPTAWKYYGKHHAFGNLGIAIDQSVMRCHICGASVRITENKTFWRG